MHVAESRTTNYIRLLRNPHKSKCADKVYVQDFVHGTHLLFGTFFKICPWSTGKYRHKNMRLSRANFNLVMNDGENNDIRILFDAPRDRKINAWCFLFRLELFFLLFSKCFDGIVLICSTKNQYFLRTKLWDLKTTYLSIWTMKSRNLQLSKN